MRGIDSPPLARALIAAATAFWCCSILSNRSQSTVWSFLCHSRAIVALILPISCRNDEKIAREYHQCPHRSLTSPPHDQKTTNEARSNFQAQRALVGGAVCAPKTNLHQCEINVYDQITHHNKSILHVDTCGNRAGAQASTIPSEGVRRHSARLFSLLIQARCVFSKNERIYLLLMQLVYARHWSWRFDET